MTATHQPDFLTQATRRPQTLSETLSKIELPKPAFLSVLASSWFMDVEQFRQLEEDSWCSKGELDPSHRMALAALISGGEHIAFQSTHFGLAPGTPFTVDDIRATVDSLRESFRGEYGPHIHPETARLVQSIFPE